MKTLYDLLPGRADFNESKYRLGRLCKRGHDWMGSGCSLRYVASSDCVQCAIDKAKKRNKENPEQHIATVLKSRARHGRPSRAKGLSIVIPPQLLGHGVRGVDLVSFVSAGVNLASISPDDVKQQLALWAHIKGMRPMPSVARLVMNEQREYWRQNPEAKKLQDRQWAKHIYAWRYKCDPSFRRHECQRNSEKKARYRGNHTVKLCKGDIDARYADFDNQCAFCGSKNGITIEHAVPRSKGGPHAIGNILPSCHDCNMSKRDHDAEQWYREQPFYSDLRWRKICRVLGWSRSSVGQMALL